MRGLGFPTLYDSPLVEDATPKAPLNPAPPESSELIMKLAPFQSLVSANNVEVIVA